MNGPLNQIRFALDHRWTPPHASAYLDRELSETQRIRVLRHAKDCPECRELLSELSTVIATLGTLRGEQRALVAGAILSSVRGRLQGSPRDGE